MTGLEPRMRRNESAMNKIAEYTRLNPH